MHQTFKSGIIFIFIIIASLTQSSAAVNILKNYSVEVINSNRGLPSDDVKDVFQDSKGFLWFCTTEGLIRYDGYTLKTYSIAHHHNKGLITNQFNAITEDQKGFLWCATDRGIAKLDRQVETFVFFNTQSPAPYTLSYDVIESIVIDHKNNLWLGTAGAGVNVINPETGVIATYSLSSGTAGMNSDWITNIYEDKSNNIWISSWQGALTLVSPSGETIKSWVKKDFPLQLTHFSPYSMTQSGKNDYWLGLWGDGIIHFSLQEDSLIVKDHIKPDTSGAESPENIIFDLIFDKNGSLWVGTPTGLMLMNHPEDAAAPFIRFDNKSSQISLSNNEAFTLLIDASGLIWVGTSGGGVNKIDNKIRLFEPRRISNKSLFQESQSVSSFLRTNSNDLYIGVKSLGFGRYNPKDQSFVQYTNLPEFKQLPKDLNTVNCFLQDSKGFLWLGTRYEGVIKYNPQSGEHIVINKNNTLYNFPSREIFDIQEDPFGHIWIATENGLYKFVSSGANSFSNFMIIRYDSTPDTPNTLSSNRISKILIDRNNHLWAATLDGGVNHSVSDITKHYPLESQRYQAAEKDSNGLITDHILTMFEDNVGNIWIGSGGGGLFRWDPEEQIFLSFEAYVSGDIIYTINQDNHNHIWIGTNRGLTRIKIENNEIVSNYFLEENGLQGNIFNKGASFKDIEGNLYFGGNQGFNIFTPLNIEPDNFIPPVVITDVKIMNKPVSVTTTPEKPIVLNHFQNNFSVTFAALSYSQPENNKYAVFLEGLEDTWRVMDADMRTLNYANLTPGNYTLHIKGSNSQGHWNPTPEKLYIKVTPAPYKTWWAFSFYVLVFGGIFYLAFRTKQKNQEVKHALKIEHIERQKSEKLNFFKQDLFSNISHEFLTPLSILSCLIDDWRHARTKPNNKDLSLAERNINRLNRLNRQFLYFSKSEIENLSLNVNKGNLKTFTQNICDNFAPLARKKNIFFTYDIDCPEVLLWFDQEKLDIVLYNLLSNAFKFTPKDQSISLSLHITKRNNKTLAIFQIKDTGKGIAVEFQPSIFDRHKTISNNNSPEGGFGIGLSLTRSMIETHKGEIALSSIPEKGTTVSFSIPVSRNAFDKPEITDNQQAPIPPGFIEAENIEEETILRIKNLQQTSDPKPKILLVEDNADFRKLLKGNLDGIFSVLEAPNGIIGYEMAINKLPNIIISDVLMPSMSGIELCKKIKQNEATAHIYFILLTAKTSDEERAEGYRAGTDSYITKPFNINTLLARMEAFLEQQQRNQKTPSTPLKSKNKITDSQDDFLLNAREIINKHLSNPEFSVKMMAEELSISNSMLYRKVSDLLDISPNTFIRKMRMIKAAELLEENHLSISEIAFQCGFKDVSYFGVTFKKDYGITPSQYQKSKAH